MSSCSDTDIDPKILTCCYIVKYCKILHYLLDKTNRLTFFPIGMQQVS